MAELYDLANDPAEEKNLIADPAHKARITSLQDELGRLMSEAGADPDAMPIDEGVKAALPDKAIR